MCWWNNRQVDQLIQMRECAALCGWVAQQAQGDEERAQDTKPNFTLIQTTSNLLTGEGGG